MNQKYNIIYGRLAGKHKIVTYFGEEEHYYIKLVSKIEKKETYSFTLVYTPDEESIKKELEKAQLNPQNKRIHKLLKQTMN